MDQAPEVPGPFAARKTHTFLTLLRRQWAAARQRSIGMKFARKDSRMTRMRMVAAILLWMTGWAADAGRRCRATDARATDSLASDVRAADALPSWNDGASRRAIVAFVEKVTTHGSPDFVPAAERIAVFDNDGTLWAEKPVPFEVFFTSDRIRALAPQHPEWKTTEPYRSVIANDSKGVAAAGKQGVMEMLAATHAGMSTDEFNRIVGRVDHHGQASADRQAVSADDLPAHAGVAGICAQQGLQDLHRLRRRPGVHARVDRACATASRRSRSSAATANWSTGWSTANRRW
jgi:hypothetical protein